VLLVVGPFESVTCCPVVGIFLSARGPSLSQSNHKIQVIWKERVGLLCYSPTSPSCVRATTVGAACVPGDLADASEGGIRAAKNCVAGGNGT
jgi:hypothetical protein